MFPVLFRWTAGILNCNKALALTIMNLEIYKGLVKGPIMHYLSISVPQGLISVSYFCLWILDPNISLYLGLCFWMYQLDFKRPLVLIRSSFSDSSYLPPTVYGTIIRAAELRIWVMLGFSVIVNGFDYIFPINK